MTFPMSTAGRAPEQQAAAAGQLAALDEALAELAAALPGAEAALREAEQVYAEASRQRFASEFDSGWRPGAEGEVWQAAVPGELEAAAARRRAAMAVWTEADEALHVALAARNGLQHRHGVLWLQRRALVDQAALQRRAEADAAAAGPRPTSAYGRLLEQVRAAGSGGGNG